MAAALGADLIFDVQSSGAEFDQRFHRARHIEGRCAETGIGIHQQRQIADIGDAPHIGQHIVQIGNTQIGQTERTCGYTAAR